MLKLIFRTRKLYKIYIYIKNLKKNDLNLNNNEISTIKHYAIGKYNKLDMKELCKSIKLGKELLFKVNSTDIIYEFNGKQKKKEMKK